MNENTFSKYREQIPQNLKAYLPLKNLRSAESAKKIPAELKDYILKNAALAEKEVTAHGWPILYASTYADFSRTGNRVNFENIYFKRRNFLNLFVLAECLENKGNYLDLITDGIFLLCEESGWQLPAHNTYIRDNIQSPVVDSTQPLIDLFAGETAAILSTTYFLLKKKLDAKSPFICKRIESEISTRIIEPYCTKHFWWMGNGDEPMCNWTPWITQNILLCAFLLPQDTGVRREILKKAFYSLDCFLKDYGEDGCCSEGAEYYRHAGLCLSNCMEIIQKVTGNLINAEFKNPKIVNIAHFIMNMNIPGTDSFFNFADCSRKAGKSGVREFLFGKQIKSKALCSFASHHWKLSTPEEKLFSISASSLKQSNLFYLSQVLETSAEIENFDSQIITAPKSPVWYESNGVFITHEGNFSLAVKAGNNADSHNHNDTGSITIYKNKKPFIIDLGVETYTQKTFSPRRYEIWTMQSAWHNLPTINGVMQKDGAKFRATGISRTDHSISFDIASAYPKEAQIKSYKRIVESSAKEIVLTDTFTCKNTNPDVVLSLLTCEKPLVNKNTINVSKTGKIEILSGENFTVKKIEEVEITDPRLRSAWKKIWRIQIKLHAKDSSGNIKIKFC